MDYLNNHWSLDSRTYTHTLSNRSSCIFIPMSTFKAGVMLSTTNSHCHFIASVLVLLIISMKAVAQNTRSKLINSTTELSSRLARIEEAQNEQARLMRCLLAGDTDSAFCLGTATYGTKARPARSCADLLRKRKNTLSGYYWVKPIPSANAVYNVYCDMTSYGGGWTLVVGINGLTRQHLESSSVGTRCRGGDVCVIHRTSGIIPVRKLDDRVIRALADDEGTFRIDVGPNSYTNFFQLPQGSALFQSNCQGTGCPRIITSHYYPYKWESNCKGVTVGYHIYDDNCNMFDNHDDGECGSLWSSSRYNPNRVLYGHTSSTGIYPKKQGFMYVR